MSRNSLEIQYVGISFGIFYHDDFQIEYYVLSDSN